MDVGHTQQVYGFHHGGKLVDDIQEAIDSHDPTALQSDS